MKKQSVRTPRNIFQERTRERECVCVYICVRIYMCTCVNERTDERKGEKDNERCSDSSVFKKSQKSNKLTILLSSVDALIKEK